MKRCANILLAMIMLFTMSVMVSAAESVETAVPECKVSIVDELIEGMADGLAVTYSSRNPGLSQYDIVKLTGVTKDKNGNPMAVTETFTKQGGVASIAFTTKYEYCADQPLTFTFYKYGNGSTGFDYNDKLYSIGGSGTPYDYVLNAYGDAVGYKFDEIITMKDTSLSQVTLVSTARSRIPPMNTYVRMVTVRFLTES